MKEGNFDIFIIIYDIVVAFIIYLIIGLFLLFFLSLKVKSVSMSTFNSLKRSNNKRDEQIYNLYFDWKESINYADLIVSYVELIELQLIVIFWGFILQRTLVLFLKI